MAGADLGRHDCSAAALGQRYHSGLRERAVRDTVTDRPNSATLSAVSGRSRCTPSRAITRSPAHQPRPAPGGNIGRASRCAYFLHQQAMQREDALRRSIGSRLRDGLRWGRRVVMDHHWHQRSVIGRPLRWLGRYLP